MITSEGVKGFFEDAKNDCDLFFNKQQLPKEINESIVKSIALKAIGLITLVYATAVCLSALTFTAAPLAGILTLATGIAFAVIAHDLLTVGDNSSVNKHLKLKTYVGDSFNPINIIKSLGNSFNKYTSKEWLLHETILFKPAYNFIKKTFAKT